MAGSSAPKSCSLTPAQWDEGQNQEEKWENPWAEMKALIIGKALTAFHQQADV